MKETTAITNLAPTDARFTIRRGDEADLVACRALDHAYSTQHVWQLAVQEESGGRTLRFQRVRLPRPLEVENTPNYIQLLQSIHAPQQLLVAEERVGGAARVLGYLTLIHEQALALTRVTQLVVTRTRRGAGIGNGLLVAAATSTRADTGGRSPNHRMRIETQSTNYPAIRFCQRCGFAFCGYDEQFYANGEIAVFFSRALYGDRRDDA